MKVSTRKSTDGSDMNNSYAGARQGRANFTGSNSIGGLHGGGSVSQALNQSVEHSNPMHAQS